MIVSGLPLLPLRPAEPEKFVTRRSARTPRVPDRDRRQHAAAVLDGVDRVAEQIAAIHSKYQRTETGAIVTALGPHLDDPQIAPQLVTASRGSDLLVSDEDRVVFRVEDGLAGLRNKAVAYAEQDTAKGNPRFQGLVARIDEIAIATIGDPKPW